MAESRIVTTSTTTTAELADAAHRARERSARSEDPLQVDPYSNRIRVDRRTIQLTETEFRIICLLASRPYRAYTPREIAQEVSTNRNSVREAALDRHITSLRSKLGFFHDYIQTVPYVGYRFKE